MSAQRVDVQNLIYIGSAVAALRCARVKETRLAVGFWWHIRFGPI